MYQEMGNNATTHFHFYLSRCRTGMVRNMRRRILPVLLLVLFSVITFAKAENNTDIYENNPNTGTSSELNIIVNGVKLVMVDNGIIMKPIEKDAVIYVPLESFLDSLGISYTRNKDSYSITVSNKDKGMYQATSAPTDAPTPKPTTTFESLSKKERNFVKGVMENLSQFVDPGSISVLEIRDGKDKYKGNLFVKISTATKEGGTATYWCVVSEWNTFSVWKHNSRLDPIENHLVQGNYNAGLLNKGTHVHYNR